MPYLSTISRLYQKFAELHPTILPCPVCGEDPVWHDWIGEDGEGNQISNTHALECYGMAYKTRHWLHGPFQTDLKKAILAWNKLAKTYGEQMKSMQIWDELKKNE